MRQFNCGYWVIERQLADLRQVFEHVGSYTSGFCWARWPIYVGFLSCFLGRVGPIYTCFWLGFCGFSWVFVVFRGFWAVSVAGKEKVAEVASHLFCFFFWLASFLCGLGTPSCQCT